VRGVVVAVAAALLLAGCSGSTSSSPSAEPTPSSSSSPAPSPSADPTPTNTPTPSPPPPAHACYRLAYADALAPTLSSRPVRCTRPHTAVTFYVGHVGKAIAADDARVNRLVSTDCPQRFATFAGGTLEDRRLSLLRTVWFTPMLEQSALGARWYSCVALALRDSRHLAVLSRVAGALDTPDGRARYGLCGTAEPGTAGFEQRICSAPHAWKALRTVGFLPGRYPGVTKVRAAGQQVCKDAGQAVASDPLSYRWSYQWPTLAQWRGGQTYGVCWAPSS